MKIWTVKILTCVIFFCGHQTPNWLGIWSHSTVESTVFRYSGSFRWSTQLAQSDWWETLERVWVIWFDAGKIIWSVIIEYLSDSLIGSYLHWKKVQADLTQNVRMVKLDANWLKLDLRRVIAFLTLNKSTHSFSHNHKHLPLRTYTHTHLHTQGQP